MSGSGSQTMGKVSDMGSSSDMTHHPKKNNILSCTDIWVRVKSQQTEMNYGGSTSVRCIRDKSQRTTRNTSAHKHMPLVTKEFAGDPASPRAVLTLLITLTSLSTSLACRLRGFIHQTLLQTPVPTHRSISAILCILSTFAASVQAGPLNYGYHGYYGYLGDHRDQGREKRQYIHGAHGLKVDTTEYLLKYGYLSPGMQEAHSISEKDVQRGLSGLQAYAHLDETGTLDNDTKALILTPRCGVKDVEEEELRQSGHRHRHQHRDQRGGQDSWNQRHLTYSIMSYTLDMAKDEIHVEISRAFSVWADVIPLVFEELESGDADITFHFLRYYHADPYSFDGPGIEYGHAFGPSGHRAGEVHLDVTETWTMHSHAGINLYNAAVHEIGHVLGLPHSNNTRDVMYPWYRGFHAEVELSSRDIQAAQALYGKREPELPVSGDGPGYSLKSDTTYMPRHSTTVAQTTTPDPALQPDPCTTSLDAAANIRSELFLFKGKWFWRVNHNGSMAGYPHTLDLMWYGLPRDFTHLDALYERPRTGKIVFFQGDRYYVFTDNRLDVEYLEDGRPITEMGFPYDIKKVDAAFVWGPRKWTYFITGDMYWRYNEEEGQMEPDYPRPVSLWRGVRMPVSTVLTDLHGVTHFFKGPHYWTFDDNTMKMDHVRKNLGTDWLNCILDVTSQPVVLESKQKLENKSSHNRYGIVIVTLLTFSSVIMKHSLTVVL